MTILQPTLIEYQKASKEEPYWWNYDKDGNKRRRFFAAELVTGKKHSTTVVNLILGQHLITIEWPQQQAS